MMQTPTSTHRATGVAGGILLVLTGLALLFSVLTGAYVNWVQPRAITWILISAVILILFGLWGCAAVVTGAQTVTTPGIAWFLLLPALVIALVNPGPVTAPALSITAAHPRITYAGTTPVVHYEPFDPAIVNDTTVKEIYDRYFFGQKDTLTESVQLRMTGFVTLADPADTLSTGITWYLTRLRIVCCAADAIFYRLAMTGSVPVPQEGSWVIITGTPDVATVPGEPAITVSSITPTLPPERPYL